MKQEIGLIGLGVMGANLARNIERNGHSVYVYNRTWKRTEGFLDGPAAGSSIRGLDTVEGFVAALERPRSIVLMVKAGEPVDAVIHSLIPLLEPGDRIVDGGNSFFRDTERRAAWLAGNELEYLGLGVSGGEEGALLGPSLMPGGDRRAYEGLEGMLESIAAVSASGPCVAYCGAGGAGHFVKMVHNGIEYGDIQLICEAYDLLRHGAAIPTGRLAEIFDEWNAAELESYLIEITARIVDHPDDRDSGEVLIDRILDRAGQKGTGVWTARTALELGVPVPTITAAVDARFLSAIHDRRQILADDFPPDPGRIANGDDELVPRLRKALYAAKIIAYAQGFDLLARASDEFGFGVDMAEVARIWTGGCIIRATLLDDIRHAFADGAELVNLLAHPAFRDTILAAEADLRAVVASAGASGFAVPAFAASLAYFDGIRRRRAPAGLLQGMRDYFGAHTYERTDREGTFHTDWGANDEG